MIIKQIIILNYPSVGRGAKKDTFFFFNNIKIIRIPQLLNDKQSLSFSTFTSNLFDKNFIFIL